MAIIKCKMCGGDLTLVEGQSVAECEYCGSRQTVPAADNEKKLTLFARANRLRAACEFDKAAGIYESVVADFPEEAEAYWGLVLCKYGIEYVDDPGTGKKIPTCHRSSFDSVISDSDFEQALENADAVARKVYRDEAKQIEEIRKGIIEVSGKEEPYDIFICYKETAENGDRTLDSVLAQDIYDALTDKGYRTFFARISLEDKLGQAYEPYIFAALNSAKIMLAVGTDYEYYNAVWVKNEWSRFLKLMEKDKSKHLIPCFKGIDAYDMPKEFAKLQAQDLGKMGAIQDILRGIEKLLPKANPVTVVQERVVVGGSGNNKIASLLDRGNMALEDGDWVKADSFFEDVLNNDSKNAQAYLGKTLAQEKCRTIDAFVRKRKELSATEKFERMHIPAATAHIAEMSQRYCIEGYVSEEDIDKLYVFDLGYSSAVAIRKRQYQSEQNYWAEHKLLSRAEKFAAGAVAENLQREKKALFATLNDRIKKAEADETAAKKELQERYAQHLTQADKKAEALYNEGLAKREEHYQSLLKIAKTSADVAELKETEKAFVKLGNYQDSKNLAEHCRKRAADEQAKLDAEAERLRLLIEKEKKERKDKARRYAIIVCSIICIVCLCLIFVYVMNAVIIPNGKYNDALAQMEAGNYETAIEMFTTLGGYKDSTVKISECETAILERRYQEGISLLNQGEYEKAQGIFFELDMYRDSKEQLGKCRLGILQDTYNEAMTLLEHEKFRDAAGLFTGLGDFEDAKEMAKESMYRLGMQYWTAKDYEESNAIFTTLGNYKDSNNRIHTHAYASVVELAPLCETNGTERFTCSTCDYSYTDSIPATGHTFVEKVITVAGCDTTGVMSLTCACGHTEQKSIDATGHTYGAGKIEKAATCTAAGTRRYTCKCGKTYTETIKATGHNHSSKVTKKATCTVDGVRTFTCSCGDSYTQAISATGHSYKAATCEKAKSCTSCGAAAGSALGHNWKHDNNGWDIPYCTRCARDINDTISVTSNAPVTTDPYIDDVITVTGIQYQVMTREDGSLQRLYITLLGTVTFDYSVGFTFANIELYDGNGNKIQGLLGVDDVVIHYDDNGNIDEVCAWEIPNGVTNFKLVISTYQE